MRKLPKQHQQPRPSIASASGNRKNADSPEMQRARFQCFGDCFMGRFNCFWVPPPVSPPRATGSGFCGFLWKKAKAKAKWCQKKSSASMDRATNEQREQLPTVSPSNDFLAQRSMRKRRMGMRWGFISPCRRRRRHRRRPPSAHRGSTSCAGNAAGCAHPAQDTSQSTGLAHRDAS